MKPLALTTLIILLLVGCGSKQQKKTLGVVSIPQPSTTELYQEEVTLALKQNQVVTFWNDMNIQYQDDDLIGLYTIEVFKEGNRLGGFQLDAFNTNPTFFEKKVALNQYRTWSFNGKMGFWKVPSNGNYTFKIVFNTTDLNLKINKANVVLKS